MDHQCGNFVLVNTGKNNRGKNKVDFLPPVGVSSFHMKAKFMDDMEKRYNGHV
jgi:hypothetical protein